MRKYRVSRFKELIFPKELIIDKFHVLSRKRHFPAFWRLREESIPLSKLASIQILQGLLFSKLIIENSGGPFPIIVDGLWNRAAREARDLLELIEREMQKREDIDQPIEGDDRGKEKPSGAGGPEPAAEPNDHHPNPTVETYATPSDRSPRSNVEPLPSEHRSENTEDIADRVPPSAIHEPPPIEPPVEISSSDSRLVVPLPRRFGNLPSDDWQPTPPWVPRPVENSSVGEDPGIRTVDPVEFLSENAPAQTALADRPSERQASPIRRLVNWWLRAKSDFTLRPPRRPRRPRLR